MSKCQLRKQFRVESKPFMPQRGVNGEITHNGAPQCYGTGAFAGGRSVGSSNPVCGSTAGPPLDGPLASLLAAREAQDRQWATPALTAVGKELASASLPKNTSPSFTQNQAIVLVQTQTVEKTVNSRLKDIQAILNGDF